MNGSPFGLFDVTGVEIEYMIVDWDTLDVRPVADEVLREVCGAYDCDYEKEGISWSNELALHLLELKTSIPVRSLAGAVPLFDSDVRLINSILGRYNCRLMPSGAHPWMDPSKELKIWPHEYSNVYKTFDRLFGCRRHGWANLQSVHINLPFADDDEFGRLHAATRLILPIIPAIAASTPFLDGKRREFLDSRLEVYRTNSESIPSLAGDIIPEQILSEAEYDSIIYSRIRKDISTLDPEGFLHCKWTNSRGAIARFDRMALEIRLVDVQECPKNDLAVASAISGATRALAEGHWVGAGRQMQLDTASLKKILTDTIRDGEKAVISDSSYCSLFGLKQGGTAGDLWRLIIKRICALSFIEEGLIPPLVLIMEEGPLARRILKAAGSDTSHGVLHDIYGRLCDCLAEGESFHP